MVPVNSASTLHAAGKQCSMLDKLSYEHSPNLDDEIYPRRVLGQLDDGGVFHHASIDTIIKYLFQCTGLKVGREQRKGLKG